MKNADKIEASKRMWEGIGEVRSDYISDAEIPKEKLTVYSKTQNKHYLSEFIITAASIVIIGGLFWGILHNKTNNDTESMEKSTTIPQSGNNEQTNDLSVERDSETQSLFEENTTETKEDIRNQNQSNETKSYTVQYGESDIFALDERKHVANLIEELFLSQKDTTQLISLQYSSDKECLDELNYYAPELKQARSLTIDECMVFYSDYKLLTDIDSPASEWRLHKDWKFIYGRKKGGEWELLTQGY